MQPPPPAAKAPPPKDKKQRLAEALRKNLKRRKAAPSNKPA